jgi:hypothetical protein
MEPFFSRPRKSTPLFDNVSLAHCSALPVMDVIVDCISYIFLSVATLSPYNIIKYHPG